MIGNNEPRECGLEVKNLERGVDDIKSNKCGISYECDMGIIVGG